MLRFLLLAALATAAHANAVFSIGFQDQGGYIFPDAMPYGFQQFYYGTLTTDGICTICSITQSAGVIMSNGIESFKTVGASGPWQVNLGDPTDIFFTQQAGGLTLNTVTGELSGSFGFGFESVALAGC